MVSYHHHYHQDFPRNVQKPPIPEPFPIGESPGFNAAFARVYAILWAWITLIYIPAIWFVYGANMETFDLLKIVLAGEVMVLVLSAICVYGFRVVVDECGLSGYNFWGFFSMISWSEIAMVRPVNFFGFRYLKLKSDNTQNVIWLPLFLANMHDFRTSLERYCGPQHPLRMYMLGLYV